MGWFKPDIYSNPESFGIEKVGEFDLSEPDYSFDIMAIWRRKQEDGTYEYGWLDDSGCSCPSPFETFYSVDDINWEGNPFALTVAFDQYLDESGYRSDADKSRSRMEFFTIMAGLS